MTPKFALKRSKSASLALAAVGLVATACTATHTQRASHSHPSAASCASLLRPASQPTRPGTGQLVVPPETNGEDLVAAYEALHLAGLRARLSEPAHLTSIAPVLVALDPPAGTAVARGSAVTLTPCPGALGSPAVTKSMPRFVVPSFDNKRLSAAVTWTGKHALYWATTLPATAIPVADGLLDAYRIVGQRPSPGGYLSQGVMTGRSFRVTPLRLSVVPI